MRVRRWNSSLFVNVPAEQKPRKPIKKVSDRQKQRNRVLADLKEEKLLTQVQANGWNWCECGCGRTFGPDSAHLFLDLHHKVHRSQGGKDTRENTELLTRQCHQTAHGVPPTKRGG